MYYALALLGAPALAGLGWSIVSLVKIYATPEPADLSTVTSDLIARTDQMIKSATY